MTRIATRSAGAQAPSGFAGSSALLARTDYWRRPGTIGMGGAGAKEWSYFCVATRELDLLVNFSVSTEPRGSETVELPRLVVMLRGSAGWTGSVDTFDMASCTANAGEVQTCFGPHTLRVDDDGYRISLRDAGAISGQLTLEPESRPALARSVHLSERGPMQWLVVPRLSASGTLEAFGETHSINAAPAYHDRNWGYFSWGGDFSWEWIVLLPTDPAVDWTIIYAQIADAARNRLFSRSVMAWHRHAPTRVFQAEDISVTQLNRVRPGRVVRIPSVAALAGRGDAADIPARVLVRAARGEETLTLELHHRDYAQLCVPHDDGCGLTQLSEVGSRAAVTGSLGGEPIAYEAVAIAEYNHAAK